MDIKKINYPVVIAGVVVAGAALYLVPKFLQKIKDAKAANAAEDTTSSNPWAFGLFLDWSKVPQGTNILTYQQAKDKAQAIYKAMNVYAFEDEDIAVGILVALPSKIQVSQVAKTFSDNYGGRDILTFLKEGVKVAQIGSGLSDDQYNRLIQNVQRKPKY
jgi:hypothetical protein